MIFLFGLLLAPQQEDVASLIRKLGSENIEEREAASKTILKIGRSALPAVRVAAQHEEPEIARRATALLDELEAHVESTVSFLERILIPKHTSQVAMLHRLQVWSDRVFKGNSWDGVPEALEAQGVAFHCFNNYFEDNKRKGYVFVLKKHAIQSEAGTKLDVRLEFEVGHEASPIERTQFTIRSATIVLFARFGKSYSEFVKRPRFDPGSALQGAVEEEELGVIARDFPFIRSISMKFCLLPGDHRNPVYSSGVIIRFDLESLGAIWHSDYTRAYSSGLEPTRGKDGESLEPGFVPADTLEGHMSMGGGKSGRGGHGLKRLDLSSEDDPLVYKEDTRPMVKLVYSPKDLSALPAETRGVRVKLETLSADQLKELRRLRSLTYLDLSNCRIDDEGAGIVASLASLERVALLCKDMTDAGFKSLAPLKKLTFVYFEQAANLTDDGLEVITAFPNLDDLALVWCEKLTDRTMKVIGGLHRLKRLKLTSIKKLTDTGMSHLTRLSDLRELELKSLNSLTSATGFAIAQMKGLRVLEFTYCDIDDDWLAEIGTMRDLEVFSAYSHPMTDSKITDQGVLRLRGMKRLVHVNVYSTKVSETAMKELGALLPGGYVGY